jgi:hypothetical protein
MLSDVPSRFGTSIRTRRSIPLGTAPCAFPCAPGIRPSLGSRLRTISSFRMRDRTQAGDYRCSHDAGRHWPQHKARDKRRPIPPGTDANASPARRAVAISSFEAASGSNGVHLHHTETSDGAKVRSAPARARDRMHGLATGWFRSSKAGDRRSWPAGGRGLPPIRAPAGVRDGESPSTGGCDLTQFPPPLGLCSFTASTAQLRGTRPAQSVERHTKCE